MRSKLAIGAWLAVAVVALGWPEQARAEQARDEYWKLGWGVFGTGLEHAKLERIRWDWIMICHGNEDIEGSNLAVNEALKYNPDQKYLVRLWPVMGLGRFREYANRATFLEYYFEPKVRAAVRETIKSNMDAVLNGIDKPENILGFTFLEEIPAHWGPSLRAREMRVDLKHYGAQIAKEMDLKTFEWNAETKTHVCGIYADTLRDIYSYIRSLAQGRKVFHWQHTYTGTIGRVSTPRTGEQRPLLRGPDDDPMKPNYLPMNLSDVICPGGADGLFTYPSTSSAWKRYMELVKEHNWPYFSQLSHPRGMHVAPWEECEKLPMTRDPLNWGSFFFCWGHCLGHTAGDDPSIPKDRDGGRQKEWAGYHDAAVHQRIFQNRHKMGIDALLSYLRPRVLVHAPLSVLKEKGRVPLTVFVHNPRDIEFWPEYLSETQTMRKVSVTVNAPSGMRVQAVGGGADMITPGAYERYDYVLSGSGVNLPLSRAIAIKVECSKSPAAEIAISTETFIPRFQTHRLEYAAEKWVEPGFQLKEAARPQIIIKPLNIPVIEKPSVSIDGENITYDGEVKLGRQLVISPDGSAKISPSNMISPLNENLRDEDSPTGFRIFEDGYGIGSYTANLPLEIGKEYLLEFEGMATGGANTQVGLRFVGQFEKNYHVDKRYQLWMGLHGRFTDQWSKVSHTFVLPEGGTGFYTLYFYRFPQQGTISYGNFSLVPVGEDRDVSDRITDKMPLLQPGRLNHVTYRDATGERHYPKVEMRLDLPSR